MIGFTPIDEQVNFSHEVRKIFIHFFMRSEFGVVAAAVQGDVDCEDYIPHFRLGSSSRPDHTRPSLIKPGILGDYSTFFQLGPELLPKRLFIHNIGHFCYVSAVVSFQHIHQTLDAAARHAFVGID